MWKNLQTLVAILFTRGKEHKHEVKEKPIDISKLQKKLAETEQKLINLKQTSNVTSIELSKVKTELGNATAQLQDAIAQSNLWMKKSAALQDKLSASLGHVTVLEGVLEESNRTIEALNLAVELRDKEETEGLQNYIDELETEMDEAVELIQKYGLELRKA